MRQRPAKVIRVLRDLAESGAMLAMGMLALQDPSPRRREIWESMYFSEIAWQAQYYPRWRRGPL